MAKYRRKSDVVDAIQWTGDNWNEVHNWIMQWGLQDPGVQVDVNQVIWIDDKEGEDDDSPVNVNLDNWIVRKNSQFSTYSAAAFDMIYEPVPEQKET